MSVINALFDHLELEDDLRRQVKEELKDVEGASKQLEHLTLQKYGLMAVQLTKNERRVIERWERKYGR